MPHPDQADIGALVDYLREREIDYVVVGGAAALLHGAATTTRDLDIVPDTRPENLDRLLCALVDLDAIYREPGPRELRPQRQHLDAGGQCLFRTRLGPLDVLLRLHGGEDYATLLTDAETMEANGRAFAVIALPRLLTIKAGTGRARDRLVVPLLLDLLRRRDAE